MWPNWTCLYEEDKGVVYNIDFLTMWWKSFCEMKYKKQTYVLVQPCFFNLMYEWETVSCMWVSLINSVTKLLCGK